MPRRVGSMGLHWLGVLWLALAVTCAAVTGCCILFAILGAIGEASIELVIGCIVILVVSGILVLIVSVCRHVDRTNAWRLVQRYARAVGLRIKVWGSLVSGVGLAGGGGH